MNIRTNDIALRPRFQLSLGVSKETALRELDRPSQEPFVISRSEDHVFIKFKREQQTFWSPQLHLEFWEEDELTCRLYGLYGPNPTLWTFFMFLHFGVATLFTIFAIWAYSGAVLGHPYALQLAAMVFLILLWLGLYAFGRAGKKKGKPQMTHLHEFIMARLGHYAISADSQTA